MDLPDFASLGVQLQQLTAPFRDLVWTNREALGLISTVVGLLAIIKNTLFSQGEVPQIDFGFDRIDDFVGDESRFVINLTNVGEKAARRVRVEWHSESSCELHPPAQPFTLLPDAVKALEFTVVPIDAILRIIRPGVERRLGSLVVTYSSGWRRRRVGTSLVMVKRDTGHAQTAIGLRPPPRKRLRDWVPAIGLWQDARAAREHAQRVADKLAWARTYLSEHGIPAEPQGENDDVFRRLLGELQRRGWAWDYESSGSGYTLKMEKSWPPSTSQVFRVFADTREEVALVALARAIQVEAERGGTPAAGEALAA